MDKTLVEGYLHPLDPNPTSIKPRGRLRMPVACLLCDLYGTLFISGSGDIGMASGQGQEDALTDLLLTRYGQVVTAPDLREQLKQAIHDEHAKLRAHGVTFPEVVIENIWRQLLPNLDQENQRRFAIEFEMINNPVWPMPGAGALLEICRKGKFRLGIISNAQFYTPYLFTWLLGQNAESLGFDPKLTFYSFQHGHAKPSPLLFDMACTHLKNIGIMPDRVAYIGNDMRNDIVPAHNAGFQTVLFAGDRRSLRLRKEEPDCNAVSPDLVVTQLDQLALYLQQ